MIKRQNKKQAFYIPIWNRLVTAMTDKKISQKIISYLKNRRPFSHTNQKQNIILNIFVSVKLILKRVCSHFVYFINKKTLSSINICHFSNQQKDVYQLWLTISSGYNFKQNKKKETKLLVLSNYLKCFQHSFNSTDWKWNK